MAEKRPSPKSLALQAPMNPSKAAKNNTSDHTALRTQESPSHGPSAGIRRGPPPGIRRRHPIIRKYYNKTSSAGDPIRPETPPGPKGPKDPGVRSPQTCVRKKNRRERSTIGRNRSRPKMKTFIARGGDHQNRLRSVISGRDPPITRAMNDANLRGKKFKGIAPIQPKKERSKELQRRRMVQDREELSEQLTQSKAETAPFKLRNSYPEGLPSNRSESPLFVAQTLSTTPDVLMSTEEIPNGDTENELFVSQTPSDRLSSRASSAPPKGLSGTQELIDEVEEAMRAGVKDGVAKMEQQYEEEPPYETCQKEDLQQLAPQVGREPRSERNKGKKKPNYYGSMHSTSERTLA